MTSAFSWQNSISFHPASFRIPRSNLPVTPGVSWLPTFAFQPPIMKRTSFWVLRLKGLIGPNRTIQLHLLQHYWSGHRFGLLWYWMVCLGNEQRSFCHFWDCIQSTAFWTLLLTMMATPFLLRNSRSGGCTGATKRSYPMSRVRSGGQKEIPHVQCKEQWLHFAGAAVKRHPMSKVRETQLRQ